jgi:hypothetical protein
LSLASALIFDALFTGSQSQTFARLSYRKGLRYRILFGTIGVKMTPIEPLTVYKHEDLETLFGEYPVRGRISQTICLANKESGPELL